MSTICELISKQHRDCDALFAVAEQSVASKDWPAAETACRRLAATMAQYFAMEEEVLFPSFKEALGLTGRSPAEMKPEHRQVRDLLAGMLEGLRAEHAQMADLLARMAQALATKDSAGWLSAGATLASVKERHDIKEDDALCPMADEILTCDPAAYESWDVINRMRDVRKRA